MERNATSASQRGKFNMGCLLAVILVIVAAGAGMFFLGKAGLGIVAEQVKNDIRDNPVILEHIGNIEEIALNLKATAAIAQGKQADRFVFDLKGTKGAGTLTATVLTIDADTEKVTQGSLRTESGATYDLFPEASPPAGD